MMNNDHNHAARISCEETFTEARMRLAVGAAALSMRAALSTTAMARRRMMLGTTPTNILTGKGAPSTIPNKNLRGSRARHEISSRLNKTAK